MSTPFRWESNKTELLKPIQRSLPQELRDAVDNLFEGTFNPEQNRKDWLIYLKDSRLSGQISKLLNVNKASDLSLMLPPINDVELPLLDKLRETLTELNQDACCYPYSARNASDIKRLINTFNRVFIKAKKISTDRNAVLNQLKVLSRSKFRLQRELLTGRLRSLATKNQTLGQLSNLIIQLERVGKKSRELKEDFENAEKFSALLKDKIERIFFARNNWKFKDLRGGAMGTDGFMLRNPNDTELNGDGTFLSHLTILEGIQEATSNLVTENIDIHPEPWKNLLIIPHDTEGLPDNWRIPKQPDLGRAANDILASTRSAAALKADWPQFATFGVEGWMNDLQRALNRPVHSVRLHAQVQIGFDKDYGTIRPNVPWWDNEILSNQNKTQIGQHKLGNHLHKTKGFLSQVGFVWEYKIPKHSRATLADTPWEMAMDQNDDPYQSFNLPRGTSIYAVRLSFIRADGSVVPISNVLTGRDVDRHFKAKVSRSLNGSSSLSNNEFTTVSLSDQRRLTDKAISLLGVKAGKNINRLQNALKAERATLAIADQVYEQANADYNDINDMRNKIKRRLAEYDKLIATEYDAWADPTGNTVKQLITILENDLRTKAATVVGGLPLTSPGTSIFDETKLNSGNIDETLDDTNGTKNRKTGFGPTFITYNDSTASALLDPLREIEDMVDKYVQSKLILSDTKDKFSGLLRVKDNAVATYNAQLEIVQTHERESTNWMAGGNVQVNDTEYSPGLISKEREINQIVSFTQHSWPELVSSTNPRGMWDPYNPTQLLPKAACLHLEPWLRKYKNEERLGFLNTASLRASNWSSSSPQPDVDSECLEHSYASWNAGEDAIASMWRAQRAQTNYSSRAEDMIERYYVSQNTVISREFAETAADLAAQREYDRKISELTRKTKLAVKLQQAEIARFERDLTSEVGTVAAVDAGRLRSTRFLQQQTDQQSVDLITRIRRVDTELREILTVDLPAAENKIQLQTNVLRSASTALDNWRKRPEDTTYDRAALDAKIAQAQLAFDNAQTEQNKNTDELKQIQIKKRTLELEQANLYKEAGKEYNDKLQRDIQDANIRIEALQKKMERDKQAYELSKELDQKRFQEESELLNKMVKEIDARFRAKMRYGDICMGAENLASKQTASNGEHGKVSAPADLRFGGGYLWKYADNIDKKVPLGEYLVYRTNTGNKNRIIRAWSGVGLSKNEGERDVDGNASVLLYESPSALMSGSLKLETKNDFVQPVLNDQIQVSKYGKPTSALFKLDESTNSLGSSTNEVYYMGKGKYVGPSAGEHIIDGYRTPFKPGTYVYFRLKSPNGFPANIQDKVYDACVEIPEGLKADSTLDLDNGAVVSGIIKTIRIMNSATAISSQEKKDALDEVKQAEKDVTDAAGDAAKTEQAENLLAAKKLKLRNLEKENGKFDYNKFFGEAKTNGSNWGPGNDAMIPILVADIAIAGGHVIKNVPYADINRVAPLEGDFLRSVLYNEDGYWREAYASTSGLKSHDNLVVYAKRGPQLTPLEVHLENVRPLYRDDTEVVYDDGSGLLKLARTVYIGNGRFTLQDKFGNAITSVGQVPIDKLSLYVANSTKAKSTIDDGNTNGLSMNIDEGLEYTTFIPKWTKITNDGSETVEDQIQGYIRTNFQDLTVATNIKIWDLTPDGVVPLFRAVIRPKRDLKTVAVNSYPIGQDKASMRDSVSKLISNKLRLAGTTQAVDDVVCWVSFFGTARDTNYATWNREDDDGKVINGSFIQIVTKNDGGGKEVANVRWDDVKEILLPQVGTYIGDFTGTNGLGFEHTSFFRGVTAAQAQANSLPEPNNWNLKPKFIRAAVKASQLKTTFALSSGTEGDSETQVDEEEEDKGWTSSWTKTEQVIAQWASSTSDSSEAEMARMSGAETKVIPSWATSSSSDEKVVESNDSAWASSTSVSKHSGGFASATSDDDADDLSAIISKIERGSNQPSAAWAEDSDSDD